MEEGKHSQEHSKRTAQHLKISPNFPRLELKMTNPQPGSGNTYKKAPNSLIHKELMRKTGWGDIVAKLSGPPAPR